MLQVASTVRVRPDDALQGYFATVTPGQVTVTGCLLSVVPKPVPSIAPAMTVTNDVTYTWAVKLESNASNPLVVQYNKPVDVIAAARVTRRPGQRSTSVQGSVQLMSQGISTLTVHRVQVRSHSCSSHALLWMRTTVASLLIVAMMEPSFNRVQPAAASLSRSESA
jgi:hypothetical protein